MNILNIKQHPFRAFVGLQSALCLLLLGGRVLYSLESWYGFLLWNLLLGLIPMYTARILQRKYQKVSIISVILLLATIAFLPNAPYLITDLIHLHHDRVIPLWYDSLLLFTFAITGLSWGIYTMRVIHKWLSPHLSDGLAWSSILLIQLASGFGIYLGRVKRLNSWDVISDPLKVVEVVFSSLMKKECFFMSLSFGALLMVLYLLSHLSIQYLKQQSYVIPEKNLE